MAGSVSQQPAPLTDYRPVSQQSLLNGPTVIHNLPLSSLVMAERPLPVLIFAYPRRDGQAGWLDRDKFPAQLNPDTVTHAGTNWSCHTCKLTRNCTTILFELITTQSLRAQQL